MYEFITYITNITIFLQQKEDASATQLSVYKKAYTDRTTGEFRGEKPKKVVVSTDVQILNILLEIYFCMFITSLLYVHQLQEAYEAAVSKQHTCEDETEGGIEGETPPIVDEASPSDPHFDKLAWLEATGGAQKGRILGIGTRVRPRDFLSSSCASSVQPDTPHGNTSSTVPPSVEEIKAQLEEANAEYRTQLKETTVRHIAEIEAHLREENERRLAAMFDDFVRSYQPHPPPPS